MHIDTASLSSSRFFIEILGKKLQVQQIQQAGGADKPYLVFLHEGLGCIELWKGFPEKLAASTGLNAIVYERQGYGQSDALSAPRPFDYLEKEALEQLPLVLKALDIQRPILVGHSDGGSIALVYASQFPVCALISEAAHVFVEEVTLQGIETVKDNPELPIIKEKLKKYHGEKTEAIFNAWADTWLHANFRTWNIEAYLEGIQCPALIIQGKDDEYATELQVARILSGMTHSTFKEALLPENCAHSPHLQAQTIVLEAMRNFIQKVLSGISD